MEKFVIRLKTGYVVALPHMIGARREQLQALLDKVAQENDEGKPVVMMGHTAVLASTATGA